jgi:hypothetical protein
MGFLSFDVPRMIHEIADKQPKDSVCGLKIGCDRVKEIVVVFSRFVSEERSLSPELG